MARNSNTKSLNSRAHTASAAHQSLDANQLKDVIRDGLVGMEVQERAAFICDLETELRRFHLDIRAYLVPLGIPGRSPDEMTPTEVGHLIRFLKLNIPQAMAAVERAMARHAAFSSGPHHAGDRLAA